MPLVKVDIEKGRDPNFLQSLLKYAMDCIQEVLKLPADDRNIRLNEYEHGFFQMKSPYKIIIEITLFSGRTIETKRILYQALVNCLHEKLAIEKDEIFILLNEQPRENWGIRGGIAGNDIDLGFKVDI